MKTRFLPFALTAFAMMIAALPAAQAAQVPAMSRGNAAFVSGGVGGEWLEQMQVQAKDFNLKLLFALKSGNYVSDVGVVISDERGNRILESVSEGPLFLARLKPGKYRVVANYDNESFSRVTTVPATGTRELIFRWDRAVE